MTDYDDAGLPESAKQKRETFARFGLAAYRAQCVEKQLAILMATTHNPEFGSSLPDEREQFFEAEFRKSLGRLVTALRQKAKVAESLEARLLRAVELRNWLAHDYYWERAHDLLSEAGRDRMISELTEAAEFLATVDEELTEITEAWFVSAGGSRDELEAEYAAIRAMRAAEDAE